DSRDAEWPALSQARGARRRHGTEWNPGGRSTRTPPPFQPTGEVPRHLPYASPHSPRDPCEPTPQPAAGAAPLARAVITTITPAADSGPKRSTASEPL